MGVSTNHLAGAKYQLLAGLVNKKQKTVRTYFNRNGLDIFVVGDVKVYLSKYYR